MDYFEEAVRRLRETSDVLYARISSVPEDLSIEEYCQISSEIRRINEQIIQIEGIRERKNGLPHTIE